MDFDKVVRTITKHLKKENPKAFSSSWILIHSPSAYSYLRKNLRTEIGHIDWDRFTVALPRKYARRWIRYKRKLTKPYEDLDELNIILNKYHDKMYTFVALVNGDDKEIRNKIVIALVRISQKGNVLAQQELVKWLKYTVEDWIDKFYPLFKWKGYTDDIEDKIIGCIYRYKYTGSFFGYLFKTLEYSARGMRSLQAWSLDDPVGEDGATRVDFVSVDQETGIAKVFGR